MVKTETVSPAAVSAVVSEAASLPPPPPPSCLPPQGAWLLSSSSSGMTLPSFLVNGPTEPQRAAAAAAAAEAEAESTATALAAAERACGVVGHRHLCEHGCYYLAYRPARRMHAIDPYAPLPPPPSPPPSPQPSPSAATACRPSPHPSQPRAVAAAALTSVRSRYFASPSAAAAPSARASAKRRKPNAAAPAPAVAPPHSPFGLLEELVWRDPWVLLLACLLLAVAPRHQVPTCLYTVSHPPNPSTDPTPALCCFFALAPIVNSTITGLLSMVSSSQHVIAPKGDPFARQAGFLKSERDGSVVAHLSAWCSTLSLP
jgi:hypothetical protein